LCIGITAGAGCYWGATGLKRLLGADDSLDVFGIHGVGGIIGALLTGVFARPGIGGASGNLLTQALGVLATFCYSAGMTYLILQAVAWVFGLRVTPAQEHAGLDVTQHGEQIA
jgi:Amt family ammonium transporter